MSARDWCASTCPVRVDARGIASHRSLPGYLGYDPMFGARPLKRAIQRMVENPLALQILAGHFREGDKLTIEPTKDGDLAFRREERKQQAA